MRTIAIGDIHGSYKLLLSLMNKIKFNGNLDKIIFLGDYIDRGEDSALVMRYVINLKKKYPENVILLIGNHEQMAYDYYNLGDGCWHFNGSDKTQASYLKEFGQNATKQFQKDLFYIMKNGLYAYEDEENIFVHAGINPTKTLSEQDKEYMIWAREEYYLDERNFDKMVVSGHTPLSEVSKTKTGNIMIDTGAVYGGKLTAFVKENKTIKFESVGR